MEAENQSSSLGKKKKKIEATTKATIKEQLNKKKIEAATKKEEHTQILNK